MTKKSLVLECMQGCPLGAGGAMAPPYFGRSVNPISTRGTDYFHLITTGTPGFSDLLTEYVSRILIRKAAEVN